MAGSIVPSFLLVLHQLLGHDCQLSSWVGYALVGWGCSQDYSKHTVAEANVELCCTPHEHSCSADLLHASRQGRLDVPEMVMDGQFVTFLFELLLSVELALLHVNRFRE